MNNFTFYKKEYYYKGIKLDECVMMNDHAAYFIMYTINGKKWIESITIDNYIKEISEVLIELK